MTDIQKFDILPKILLFHSDIWYLFYWTETLIVCVFEIIERARTYSICGGDDLMDITFKSLKSWISVM